MSSADERASTTTDSPPTQPLDVLSSLPPAQAAAADPTAELDWRDVVVHAVVKFSDFTAERTHIGRTTGDPARACLAAVDAIAHEIRVDLGVHYKSGRSASERGTLTVMIRCVYGDHSTVHRTEVVLDTTRPTDSIKRYLEACAEETTDALKHMMRTGRPRPTRQEPDTEPTR